MEETFITIDSQFNGPPDHCNGGYLAGIMSSFLKGPVEITINNLVPLNKKLLVKIENNVSLYDGSLLLSEAKNKGLKISPPFTLDFEEASKWSEYFRGTERAVQKNCFVCGCERKEGDGLRIFPGRMDEQKKGPVAAPFIPHENFGDKNGRIDPVYLWSVLDCPGYWSTADPSEKALLGKITGVVMPGIRVHEKCVVIAWPLGDWGFAFQSGTAIFNGAGKLKAISKQIWVRA